MKVLGYNMLMRASKHGLSYPVECFMTDINLPKVRKILFCILRTQENWCVRFRKLKRNFEMPARRGYFDDKIHQVA